MKITATHLLIAGLVLYLVLNQTTATTLLPPASEPEPAPDPLQPGAENTGDQPIMDTQVDVYSKTNEYHHTEIMMTSGRIGIYFPDENGVLQFVKYKPVSTQTTTTSVSGIYGPRKRRIGAVYPRRVMKQALL